MALICAGSCGDASVKYLLHELGEEVNGSLGEG